MVEALQTWLMSQGYTNIYLDSLPPSGDAIRLFCWDHKLNRLSLGPGTEYVQVSVRRSDYDEAKAVSNELTALLDSGPDEDDFELSPGMFCVIRPRRGPVLSERNNKEHTFYFEIALCG